MRNNRTDCVTILIHNVIYLLLIKNAFDYVIGGLDFTHLFVLQLSIALRARTQRQLARPRPIYRSSFHRRGSARSRRCRSSVRSRSAARRSLAPAPAPRARRSGRSRCPRGCYCRFALFGWPVLVCLFTTPNWAPTQHIRLSQERWRRRGPRSVLG